MYENLYTSVTGQLTGQLTNQFAPSDKLKLFLNYFAKL